MTKKKESITARPKWNAERKVFIIPKKSGYTKEESEVIGYIGELLVCMAEDMHISVEKILALRDYHSNPNPDISAAHRFLLRFIYEHFPTAIHLFLIVLSKTEEKMKRFIIHQNRFFSDPTHEISFDRYNGMFKKQHPVIRKIVFPKRTIAIPEEVQEFKIPEAFKKVSPVDLIEIIFETVKEKFNIDLTVYTLGTKDKCIPYNLYVSRKISIGIILLTYGENFSFVELHRQFAGRLEYSQINSSIDHYKNEHHKCIMEDAVYNILYAIIYTAILQKIEVKKSP